MEDEPEDDEDALWAKVTASAAPLKGRRPPSKLEKPRRLPPSPKPRQASPVAAKTPPASPPAAVKAPLDRKTARELEKGRIEVEARLDLHGMRQRDAHAQLKRFLKTAQAKGLKHVLVITGKGASLEASKSFYAEDERGVLRNAVPHWLAEPDFAGLVVSVSPAPRRLDGEGALYVRLRRRR